jgi:hypothetical protein
MVRNLNDDIQYLKYGDEIRIPSQMKRMILP